MVTCKIQPVVEPSSYGDGEEMPTLVEPRSHAGRNPGAQMVATFLPASLSEDIVRARSSKHGRDRRRDNSVLHASRPRRVDQWRMRSSAVIKPSSRTGDATCDAEVPCLAGVDICMESVNLKRGEVGPRGGKHVKRLIWC